MNMMLGLASVSLSDVVQCVGADRRSLLLRVQ